MVCWKLDDFINTFWLHLTFIENRLQKLLLLICFFGRLTFMVAIGNNNESSNWSRPYCNETLSNFKESKKKDNAYCTACSKQGFWPNNDRVSFKSLRSIDQLIKCMYFCWREQYYTQKQGVHISILPKSLKVGFFSESAMCFSHCQNKYSKSLSWTWNLNFPPITVDNLFKFQAQDSDLEYLFWQCEKYGESKIHRTFWKKSTFNLKPH